MATWKWLGTCPGQYLLYALYLSGEEEVLLAKLLEAESTHLTWASASVRVDFSYCGFIRMPEDKKIVQDDLYGYS